MISKTKNSLSMPYYQAYSRNPRRLKGYDYRTEGWYFVTICTKNRIHYFGHIMNGQMHLSDIGQVVHDYWMDIPQHFPHILLQDFVVMPNHIHGIIGIVAPLDTDDVIITKGRNSHDNLLTEKNGAFLEDEASLHCSDTTGQEMAALSPKKNSLSRVIGTYKAACTKMIRSISEEPFGWQPRFHDRIIRDEEEMQRITRYIRNNPLQWWEDRHFK